jgi:hypothetical protein
MTLISSGHLHKVADLVYMLQDARSTRSLLTLVVSSVLILALRTWLTGGYVPTFAAADNPASRCDSLLTRAFTFFYLPAFNFGLLLYPSTLSFDWSMDSIPLIRHVLDFRNMASFVFYGALMWSTYKHIIYLNSVPKHHHKQETMIKYAITSTSDVIYNDRSVICKQLVSELQHRPALNFFSLFHHGLDTICSWLSCLNTKQESKNYRASFQRFSRNSYPVQCLCTNTSKSPATKPKTVIDDKCVRRQDSVVVLMSVAMMVIPFLPASNLVAYVGFVVAERVLYIPSLGFCLLVGHGFVKLMEKVCDRKYRKNSSLLLMLSLTLVLITLAGKTFIRNRDWKSEESLYRSGISVNPAKGKYST